MKTNTLSDIDIVKSYSTADHTNRSSLGDLMFNSSIPREELMNNISLFIDRRNLSRILFINELYQKILPLHGNIIEFGTRYGTNLSLFTSLRGIFEPFNHNRKVIAFDTFSGFPEVSEEDKNNKFSWQSGDYSVPELYEDYLEQVLTVHEQLAPLPGIKKFELVKGDATATIHEYLASRQETIIALAYFDFDLYSPTKTCLEAIVPYLTKGAVIGFDEINVAEWPGETAALREVLGTKNFRIYHSAFRANAGYMIFE
ncbi:MAG: crotonobetainyl-CoA--carnitine CoA-transferase [Bacteroidota bacterium]